MIAIVTDSTSDLPEDVAARHRIAVVPLTVRFGDREFTDLSLEPGAFWRMLRSSPTLPETAAPGAGAFYDTFTRLDEEGAEGIVAVCLSSSLSATYQSAVIAAEKVADDIPVRVVDSRAVSMALGLQALEAARLAGEGRALDDVSAGALAASASTNILAALDSLEFLRRGGRIGNAQALLGSILDVKPLITLADGVVAAAGRVRTRTKARAALAAKVTDLAPRLRALAVLHGSADDVDDFLEQVRVAAPGIEPIVADLGPVVGTHTGPGALGVAYLLD